MNSHRKLSYQTVTSELLRLCPWVENNYTPEDVIRSMDSIIKLAGAAAVFETKTTLIQILNSRAEMPGDLYSTNALAYTKFLKLADAEKALCEGTLSLMPMKLNNDDFKRTWKNSASEFRTKSAPAYTLNNNHIYTNFAQGVVAISYKAIPTDGDGNPMIPLHESWLLAAVWDCATTVANRMHFTDKLEQHKFILAANYRKHYISQAGVSSRMPNKAEAIQHKNNQMSEPDDHFPESSFFANFGRIASLSYRRS
jgi:hypothetical protein